MQCVPANRVMKRDDDNSTCGRMPELSVAPALGLGSPTRAGHRPEEPTAVHLTGKTGHLQGHRHDLHPHGLLGDRLLLEVQGDCLPRQSHGLLFGVRVDDDGQPRHRGSVRAGFRIVFDDDAFPLYLSLSLRGSRRDRTCSTRYRSIT